MRTQTLCLLLFTLAACSSDDETGSSNTGGISGSAGSGGGSAGGSNTGGTEQGGSGGGATGGTGGGATGGTGGGETGGSGGASSYDCQSPHPSWLLCEDFEQGGGDWDLWEGSTDFLGGPGTDDRGRIDLDDSQVHSGSWAVHYPASAGSGYQGAGLDWWACDGEQASNCSLRSYDQLYFRAWIRFASDHRYVHHFLNISGSQPDDYWYHGTAGCMPNGELAMGTTVDHRTDSHESHFYTYYPGMNCDTNCGNYADVASICQECADKGLPTCDQQQQCCWGNHFEPDPAHAFPVGEWFCFEMTMRANTVGQSDGEMAYWVDDQLIHQESGMMWRTSPTLALNRVRLQHYITSSDAEGHSNRVWFDDVIVSTERVGCQ